MFSTFLYLWQFSSARAQKWPMTMMRRISCGTTAMLALLAAIVVGARPARAEDGMDLTHATQVVRSASVAPLVEQTAAKVLAEEVEKRSGVKWREPVGWPERGFVIALVSGKDPQLYGKQVPERARIADAEGYGLATDTSNWRAESTTLS